MKKYYFSLIILLPLLFGSCGKSDSKNNEKVNQFVFDGMSYYYLWANEMLNKKPSDGDPKKYFDGLLNSTDKAQGWSFITDDIQSLVAEYAGTPKEFGFALAGVRSDKSDELYVIIKYVYPNSPAANAGLKRLDLITAIDGEAITEANTAKLFGSNKITLTKRTDGVTKNVDLTPAVITTNPVLHTSIHTYGSKKIGYIFYTSFISNYNESLFQAFNHFKQEGVTDLVVDLRYNHGGAVTAAVYLASLIAPRNDVEAKKTYVKMNYNNYVNDIYDSSTSMSRIYQLGDYYQPSKNPLNANLDLKNVYVIATNDSYSASELIIHCLRPYMNVVHIGSNTGGKYTASWTIHAYDENYGMPLYKESSLTKSDKDRLYNWAIQPIVAVYTDKDNKDFSAKGYLVPNSEIKEGFGFVSGWREIGDPQDVLLGEALYQITGDNSLKPTQPSGVAAIGGTQRSEDTMLKLDNPKETKKRAVWIDNASIIRN